MTTAISKNNGELTVKVDGQLDTVTSEDFIQTVEKELEGVSTVVIDCSGLTYISSAGLRALIALGNDLGDQEGSVRLRNVGEQVAEVLKLTGMNELFPITE